MLPKMYFSVYLLIPLPWLYETQTHAHTHSARRHMIRIGWGRFFIQFCRLHFLFYFDIFILFSNVVSLFSIDFKMLIF